MPLTLRTSTAHGNRTSEGGELVRCRQRAASREGTRVSHLVGPQSRIRLALAAILFVNTITFRAPQPTGPSSSEQSPHHFGAPFPFLFSVVAPGSAQVVTVPPDTSTGITSTDPVLYITDDLILLNPVEGTTLFMMVIILGAAAEIAFDKLKGINDHGFHTVFGSIVEETMLCGIMSMVLIFVTSLGKLSSSWLNIINNSVLTLLIMAVYFALLAFGVLKLVKRMMGVFREFESSRMGVDPLLSVREQIYKESEEYFRETVSYHKLKVDGVKEILYADYLHNRSAHVVAQVFDLSWKNWLVLAVFVIVNGVRSRIALGTDSERSTGSLVAHYMSYIIIIGFLPISIYAGLHVTLRMRLSKVIGKPVVDPSRRRDPRHNITEEATPSRYLFFGDLGITTSVFQSIILMIEWYLAYFTLNMIGTGFHQLGPLTALFLVLSISPLLVFAWLFPWTVVIVTMLDNLGTDLKEDVVIELANTLVAEQHGVAALEGGSSQQRDRVGISSPSAQGKRPPPKRHSAAYNRRQQTVLGIDDEWDSEHPILLCEEITPPNHKSKKREDSAESMSNRNSTDSDDKSPSDDDSDNSDIRAAKKRGNHVVSIPVAENVSAAILDRNYLRDKQRERDRVYAKEQAERKAKFEQEAAQRKAAASGGGLQPMNGGDILKPMYVPDWRFNPILARQNEMDRQRERYFEEQRTQQELEDMLTAQMGAANHIDPNGSRAANTSRFNKKSSADVPFEL